MKVLSVGGGSGGHVTPALAVINELANIDPSLEALFVCDRAFSEQSRGLMQHASVPVRVLTIPSGKLRRYHGVPIWRQLLDLPTVARNIIDLGKIVGGLFASWWLLVRERPDVVFAKGGFVCLPMGYAARALGIPLVIHDSDARPGLTNTLLARFATAIATGTPLENYQYDTKKTRYVGVPISPDFRPVATQLQVAYKQEIGVDDTRPLVVVTGGGLGAASINQAITAGYQKLLMHGATVYHVCGKKHYDKLRGTVGSPEGYYLVPFVYKDMYKVLAAADVVVSRASATFTQEVAALRKPAILIPAHMLNDQVKNAAVYEKAQAARVLSDDDIKQPSRLADEILMLLNDPVLAEGLAERLHAFARPDAAHDTAEMIATVAQKGSL